MKSNAAASGIRVEVGGAAKYCWKFGLYGPIVEFILKLGKPLIGLASARREFLRVKTFSSRPECTVNHVDLCASVFVLAGAADWRFGRRSSLDFLYVPIRSVE